MKKPTDDDYREILAAVERCGSITAAAAEFGIARQTMQDRIRNARTRLGDNAPKMVEYPKFVTEGDEEENIEDILGRMKKAQALQQKAAEARNWFPIKIAEEKPYGFLVFGDPHLGVSTDWPLLERHLAVAANRASIAATSVIRLTTSRGEGVLPVSGQRKTYPAKLSAGLPHGL